MLQGKTRNQGCLGCSLCACILAVLHGPTSPAMSYCRRLVGPQSSSWEEADVECEVKSGIRTMAEWVPSFGGRALRQEARSAAGQHVHRAAEKKPVPQNVRELSCILSDVY